MDQAKERNSKGYTVYHAIYAFLDLMHCLTTFRYKKAYNAMKDCPLTFAHPSEAEILQGVGPTLCKRLTDNLQKHCEENGLPMARKTSKRKNHSGRIASDAIAEAEAGQSSPVQRKRKAQPYVPKYRSGAYGLIVALSTLDRE